MIMKLLQEIRNVDKKEEEFKELCFLLTLKDITESV